MTFTAHGTKDICRHCGKEVTYDADEGYWEALIAKVNGIEVFTPFSCKNPDEAYHEPTNHTRNIRGFYCTNESLK